MDLVTRLSKPAHPALGLVALITQGAAAVPARAQAVTPAPVAEPLVADWVWVAALVVALVGVLWYFLRTRRS